MCRIIQNHSKKVPNRYCSFRFKNNEPVKADKRVTIVKEGRKRKIVIKDAKVTDAGNFKCVSNADETACELIVNCKYMYLFNFKTSQAN